MNNVIKILLISCSITAAPALAKTNYKNQLVGGRAAMLGGAFTAVADDASAMLYNPAGMVYVQENSVSGSANAFGVNSQNYEKTVGTEDWKRDSENLTPTFFGLAKKQGKWAIGLGYFQEDFVKENQNQIYENLNTGTGSMEYYSLILNTEDSQNLLGFSAAYEFNSQFSLGLTLNYSFRHYLKYQDQYVRYYDTDTEYAFDHREVRTKGVKPILGMLWSPEDKWSVGLTVANDFILKQNTEDVRNKLTKGSSATSFVRVTDATKDKNPVETKLGIAYFSSASTLYSMNIDYYLETDQGKDNVLNASIGTEYYTSPKFALRGALFTNRSNVKALNTTTRNLDQRVNIYGASFGVASFTPASELGLGVIASRGSGQLQPFSGSTAIRDFTYFDLKMLIHSSYNF